MIKKPESKHLLYTHDIDVLVTALRELKKYAEEHGDEHIPARVDDALMEIGLVP